MARIRQRGLESCKTSLREKGLLLLSIPGHLTIEKILKAIYVDRTHDTPPYTHRLIHLSEMASLELTDEQVELLETVTDFNLEARYPDEKFTFKKKCTRHFTEQYLKKIEVMRKWLLSQIQQ